MLRSLSSFSVLVAVATLVAAQAQTPAAPPTPADVRPGSITCDECPYPYPSSYLQFTAYGQDMRMAYMDVAPLISQVPYLDPVVDDWAHIRCPTLAFGGAEDSLAGPAAVFQERMRFIADTVPNGNGSVHLIAGLGHVPHVEDPDRTFPPLLAFLKAGVN